MLELVTGDKVEITEHSKKEYIGMSGKVIHVGSTPKGITRPVNTNLPKQEFEPYYGVVLDDGREVQNLKEHQLRKL